MITYHDKTRAVIDQMFTLIKVFVWFILFD